MASDQDTSFASGALHGYADAARTPRRYLEFHESWAGFFFGPPVSAKNQARLKEKSISSSRSLRSNELSARLRAVRPLSAFFRYGVLMKDPVTRIATICLDIGIIVLVFVSLFWNWPPIKTQESSPVAIPDLHAHVQQ